MQWIWDAPKARRNLKDHGVSFEAAALVFDDPMFVSEPDPYPDEDRWRAIGRVHLSTLFVVHTLDDEGGGGRIISARKATRTERKRYDEGYS
ncbi:MAG: BrnT family toxin [Sphingomonadaceae bacterium]|nr:BrnT family toxin [Sphingomonadaceae bacterium]